MKADSNMIHNRLSTCKILIFEEMNGLCVFSFLSHYLGRNFQSSSEYARLLLFSHRVMSDSLATPWTSAYQALLSEGFARQEYLNELPFPSPGDLLPTQLILLSHL